MPAAERMDLWRASALQNAFSGASAHDDSAARALPKTIANINYEVRFTRMAISFGVHTLTRRNRSHEAVVRFPRVT